MRRRGPDRPQVSIGLPLLHGSQHLRETVESLLGQSWKDFEVVIVDCSASSAAHGECRRLAAFDARVRYVRRGALRDPAEAHALAFRRARGAFFRWTTCDEVYAVDFLRRCVDALERHDDAVLCYLPAKLIDAQGRFVGNHEPKVEALSPDPAARLASVLRSGRPVCGTLGLVRTSALARTGLVRRGPAAMHLLLAELALHGSFQPVPEYLLYARTDQRPAARRGRGLHDALRGRVGPGACRLRLRELLGLAPAVLRAALPWRTRLTCVRVLLQDHSRSRQAGARSGVRGTRASQTRLAVPERVAGARRT